MAAKLPHGQHQQEEGRQKMGQPFDAVPEGFWAVQFSHVVQSPLKTCSDKMTCIVYGST